MCTHMYICVYMCVERRERDRGKEREGERGREREGERESESEREG